MAEYKILEVVKMGNELANARIPPLQPTAIGEFCEILSRQVTAGDWVQIGDDVSNVKGQTVKQVLEMMLLTRPHWEVPKPVVEKRSDVWLSGNLRTQGERWKEIRAVFGPGKEGDRLATQALTEEAALYGTTPGSTIPGTAPGSKPKNDGSGPNPWDVKHWRGSEAHRLAEIDRLIKLKGTKLAGALAAKAGVTLSGHELYPLKGTRRV